MSREYPQDPLDTSKPTKFPNPATFRNHILRPKEDLNGNPQIVYDKYKVVSCTRFKDLYEWKYHEFLSFLILNTQENTYSKIFAQRDINNDTIIAGRLLGPQMVRKRQDAKDADIYSVIPLQTLCFHKDQMPTVLQVANVLLGTNQIAPDYNALYRHCYWYAEIVIKTLEKQFTLSNRQNWSFWSTGSYVIPALTKNTASTKKTDGFDPTRLSHHKRLNGFRRNKMVDLTQKLTNQELEKYLQVVQVEPNPAGADELEAELISEDTEPDLPEIPEEGTVNKIPSFSKSQDDIEAEMDQAAIDQVEKMSGEVLKRVNRVNSDIKS